MIRRNPPGYGPRRNLEPWNARNASAGMHNEVLVFWFEETAPRMWWAADPVFDRRIEDRFLPLLQQAARGELASWRVEPKGRLAEIIVLDQFSRNIYRGTPRAFAADSLALALAQEAVSAKADDKLTQDERTFLLMPYMHSESKNIHVIAEQLFKAKTAEGNYNFELRHKAIIDRFGRSAAVVAMEHTTLAWLTNADFWNCLRSMPALAFNLAGILSRRLRLSNAHVVALATLDLSLIHISEPTRPY